MRIALTVINIFGQLLALLVILYVVIQMIFPKSETDGVLSRLLAPLLNPIRKRVKPYKGFDWAPLILLVLILIVEIALTFILGRFVD